MKFTVHHRLLSHLVEACSAVENAPLVLHAERGGGLRVGATFQHQGEVVCAVEAGVAKTGTVRVHMHAFRRALAALPVGPVSVEKAAAGLCLSAPSVARRYMFGDVTWGGDAPRKSGLPRATTTVTLASYDLLWLLRATTVTTSEQKTLLQWGRTGMRATTIGVVSGAMMTLHHEQKFTTSGVVWLGHQERESILRLCDNLGYQRVTIKVSNDGCSVEMGPRAHENPGDDLTCFFTSPDALDDPIQLQVRDQLPMLLDELLGETPTTGIPIRWSQFIEVVRGLCCSDSPAGITLQATKGTLRFQVDASRLTAIDEVDVDYEGPERVVTVSAPALLDIIAANGNLAHGSKLVYLDITSAHSPLTLRSIPPYFTHALLMPLPCPSEQTPPKSKGKTRHKTRR